MIKLLVILIAGYLLYRWVWSKAAGKMDSMDSRSAGEVVDEMLKDPHCQAFFPKNSGVSAIIDGQSTHFCSPQCRDAYLAARKQKKQENMEP